MVVVLMGVSGSGKTTVGRALASRLGWPFHDADDFHPRANVEKMHAGIPLSDEDRAPWLAALHDAITRWLREGDAVLAGSVLARRYRDELTIDGTRFVFLDVDRETLQRRLQARKHFMPASLLDSQLAALERPSRDEALIVDGAKPVDAVVDAIVPAL